LESVTDENSSEISDISKELEEVEKSPSAEAWGWRDESASLSHSITEYMSTYIDNIELTENDAEFVLIAPIQKQVNVTKSLIDDFVKKYDNREEDNNNINKSDNPEEVKLDMGNLEKSLQNIEDVTKSTNESVESLTLTVSKLQSRTSTDEEVEKKEEDSQEASTEKSEEVAEESTEKSETQEAQETEKSEEPVEEKDDSLDNICKTMESLAKSVGESNKATLEAIKSLNENIEGISKRVSDMEEARATAKSNTVDSETSSTGKVEKSGWEKTGLFPTHWNSR
jgi:chromosome segregation ATPase